MPTAPTTFQPPWLPRRVIQQARAKEYDARRGSARERGYTTKWEKARKTYLAHHPLCACCAAQGMTHPAAVLDHIEPHKQDMAKFWDRNNWQGLCEWCDKNIKRAIENDWLAGRASFELLNLSRRMPGWVHPRARDDIVC